MSSLRPSHGDVRANFPFRTRYVIDSRQYSQLVAGHSLGAHAFGRGKMKRVGGRFGGGLESLWVASGPQQSTIIRKFRRSPHESTPCRVSHARGQRFESSSAHHVNRICRSRIGHTSCGPRIRFKCDLQRASRRPVRSLSHTSTVASEPYWHTSHRQGRSRRSVSRDRASTPLTPA